jgi:acyl-CoA thioester hydrolase
MRRRAEIAATHHVRVRYGETDQMGVAYHANYIVWFNEARDALLAGIGIDPAAAERLGLRFPVIEVACRYLHPARYRDLLELHTRLRYEGVARLEFHFDVTHAKSHRLLAAGHSVSAVTGGNGKLLLRLPRELARPLEAALAAGGYNPGLANEEDNEQ